MTIWSLLLTEESDNVFCFIVNMCKDKGNKHLQPTTTTFSPAHSLNVHARGGCLHFKGSNDASAPSVRVAGQAAARLLLLVAITRVLLLSRIVF